MQIMGKDFPSFHAAVDTLECLVKSIPEANQGPPPAHRITPGLYSRRIVVPAGTLIITKTHKKEHQFIVFKGRATVFTERGAEVISAPYAGVTPAGTRRVVLVLEETDWMTFHPTQETELDKIEDDLIIPRNQLEETPTISELCPG